MAFKPRTSKPRNAVRKYKNKIAKKKRTQKKLNEDTFAMKFVNEATLTPVQGVTVANYVSWQQPIMNYANLLDFSRNSEFILYTKMYDQYRVNSVIVEVIPKANVLSQVEAQDDNKQGGLNGDGMYHIVMDRNGLAPTTIPQLVKYPSYKKISLLKKSRTKYSVKYPVDFWLDTILAGSVNSYPANYRNMGLYGNIAIYAENLVEDWGEVINEPWASIVVTYNVVFQGKNQAQLSIMEDDNGNKVVTLKDYDVTLNKEPSKIKNVKGTWQSEVVNDAALPAGIENAPVSTYDQTTDGTPAI